MSGLTVNFVKMWRILIYGIHARDDEKCKDHLEDKVQGYYEQNWRKRNEVKNWKINQHGSELGFVWTNGDPSPRLSFWSSASEVIRSEHGSIREMPRISLDPSLDRSSPLESETRICLSLLQVAQPFFSPFTQLSNYLGRENSVAHASATKGKTK